MIADMPRCLKAVDAVILPRMLNGVVGFQCFLFLIYYAIDATFMPSMCIIL
jgi:hypothetical protein